MPLRLDADIAQSIDQQIWDIYGDRLGGNELSQLAKLFKGGELLQRLAGVLWQTLEPGRVGRDELEISLAWIDKRPLAKLAASSQRVELGDAAFFFFDMIRGGGTVHYSQSRALVLQAKAAEEKGQMLHPVVPVNPTSPPPTSSTAREFELLSKWDTFDLYKTSASARPIVRAISVAPPGSPPPNGWYMATPKARPDDEERRAWPSPWMCAPAENHAPCHVTLGELLFTFLTSSPHPSCGVCPPVGVDFRFQPRLLLAPEGHDWDRLCIELLRLCPQNSLPQYLFGARRSSASGSIVLRSLPYVGDGWGRRFLLGLRDLFFPRQMPVLLIAITRSEGEG